MRPIDIFIQGGEATEVIIGQAAPIDNIAGVLTSLQCPVSADVFVFLEDMHAPLDPEMVIEELLPLRLDDEAIVLPLRLHLSRHRHVEVTVRFNGEVATRRFSPGATIGRVHHWAARRAFGLAARDAAEHVLQICGTQLRPDRDVHVGTLTSKETCIVAFDLIPRKRVEG